MWSHTGNVHYSCKSSLKGTSVHSHQKIAGNNLVVISGPDIQQFGPRNDDSKLEIPREPLCRDIDTSNVSLLAVMMYQPQPQ